MYLPFTLEWYPSFVSVAEINYPDKKQSGGEGFSLSHNSKFRSIMVGTSPQQMPKGAFTSKAEWCLLDSQLALYELVQSRAQQQGMVPPTSTLGLSPSIPAIKTSLQTCLQVRFSSQAILGCIRLTELTMTYNLPHHQHLRESDPFIINLIISLSPKCSGFH